MPDPREIVQARACLHFGASPQKMHTVFGRPYASAAGASEEKRYIFTAPPYNEYFLLECFLGNVTSPALRVRKEGAIGLIPNSLHVIDSVNSRFSACIADNYDRLYVLLCPGCMQEYRVAYLYEECIFTQCENTVLHFKGCDRYVVSAPTATRSPM